MSEKNWLENLDASLELLATDGYFEVLDFIDEATVMQLVSQVNDLRAAHQFRAARVGARPVLETEVRSDEIFWLDSKLIESSKELQKYFENIGQLQRRLNEKYFFGLRSNESHFSRYPSGASYKRHKDVSEHSNKLSSAHLGTRKISIICYLNSNWRPEHGGQLRLYLDKNFVDVTPTVGKLVGFLSEEIEHEVLTTFDERLSLTSWLLN